MKKFGLYKKEKLCSTLAIQALFDGRGLDFSALAYPLRAVARRNNTRYSDAPLAFLISVPKKRLRHAVDRVLMRRRVREAYRLAKAEYPLPAGVRVDLAFIYVGNATTSYAYVDKAVRRILGQLVESLSPKDEINVH